MKELVVFWFRRDLRLQDNCALYKALQSGKEVLPIFIFDSEILDRLPKDDARVSFIYHQLEKINHQLKKNNSSLYILKGNPLDVFNKLTSQFPISAIFTNRDYEPYAKKRDADVESFLSKKGIDFYSYKDQVIFETNEITKADGKPYVVYTPYSKKWLEAFKKQKIKSYPSQNYLQLFYMKNNLPFLLLSAIGFKESALKVTDFIINNSLIDAYESTRNFPALDKTSRLGPHLRFGTISIRQMVEQAAKSDNPTFLKELIWREFFMQILWHYPQTATQCFKPKYERIEWRNNEKEFKKWCMGTTGFPLVDAGMNQLNATGFMHNRVRMLVGSFLCKHLLIDWRWGEAYFAKKLHDYEMASNVGNWQWVAGCGVDAAPYFRIFNPTSQILKFDKNHAYLKKWVPNYQELTYPTPMVDHKFARERCLKVYKQALE